MRPAYIIIWPKVKEYGALVTVNAIAGNTIWLSHEGCMRLLGLLYLRVNQVNHSSRLTPKVLQGT
jgi:hypothetical protein